MIATTFAGQALAAPLDKIAAPVIDLRAVLPLLIVLGGACLGVLVEAVLPRTSRYAGQLVVAIGSLVAAGVCTIWGGVDRHFAVTFGGAVAVDTATYAIWGATIVLALISVLLIADRVSEPGGAFVAQAAVRVGSARDREATATATPMQTEIFPLTLFAVGGMLVFPAASDLLTLFIALEVLSLPLYLMCGMARRRRLISQEAAVKYFLLGAFTSAILLYGIALLYGYAGTLSFRGIAEAARAGNSSDTLLLVGIALLIVGLLFKASVGPFHLWTPDVYQGAPTPVTAFMASCTKIAAFATMLRVFMVALQPMVWTWRPVLWAVAIVSMAVGAVLGITQTDMKRMLAYSSIAHAGFLLLGVMAVSQKGASGTLFYLLTYGLATIGGFAVVTLVRRSGGGEAGQLSDWAGLAKRSPILAGLMTVFLLSFAGIPLTAGFIGKLTVFSAAIAQGMGGLVVIAMIATAVTAFFYLRVIVLMYFSEPAVGERQPYVASPGLLTVVVLAVCAVGTVLLGIVPGPAIDWLTVSVPFLS